jgi:hypothetical protein
VTWEYKFVDVKNDRKTFEQVITQHGKDGWEFCSSERFGQGELVLVFKKRKGGDFGPFAPFGPFMMPGGIGAAGPAHGPNWRDWGVAGLAVGGVEAGTFKLQRRDADEVVKLITEAHPKAIKVVGEPRTNMIIVVADAATMKQITALIERLDAKPVEKPKAGPGVGPGVGIPPGMGFPPGAGIGPMGGVPPGAGAKPIAGLNVFTLKHAHAEELVGVLKKLYANVDMSAEPRTYSIIVRGDEKVLDEIRSLLARLDVEVPKPR